ncbi:potassium channel family protein [Ihubacter sp. rT4E-8]|uniref:potassium channel family protein n=1 Tax=unclassified Ihubacter TaxID=2633299 RepID=UPI0013798CF2
MRSVLVIGLGRFGRHLATNLSNLGNEVMVIDIDENAVNKLAPIATAAQIGDCTDEIVLKELGVSNFDLCFVCISHDLEASMIITMTLKELGAKKVITKVNQDIHVKFLLSNGADNVIYPERDMAFRTAMKYSAQRAFDYVELSEHYGIFEIEPPAGWIGRSLTDINVRKNYHVNIIAYKYHDLIMPLDNGDYYFAADQHLIVAGDMKNFHQLIQKDL